jgi:pimeloyl-ACP methyl ester carboxylesterase
MKRWMRSGWQVVRWFVVGHSMGGALALRWAARHTPRVRAVITLCAALYRNRDEADGRLRQMGTAEALLAEDGPLPQMVRGWMCRPRALAGWIAVALRPDLPVTVARSAVKHTWDSYYGSLQGCVRCRDWEPALGTVAGGCTPDPPGGRRRPGPCPRARAATAATTTLKLGTYVLQTGVRDPSQVAGEAVLPAVGGFPAPLSGRRVAAVAVERRATFGTGEPFPVVVRGASLMACYVQGLRESLRRSRRGVPMCRSVLGPRRCPDSRGSRQHDDLCGKVEGYVDQVGGERERGRRRGRATRAFPARIRRERSADRSRHPVRRDPVQEVACA